MHKVEDARRGQFEVDNWNIAGKAFYHVYIICGMLPAAASEAFFGLKDIKNGTAIHPTGGIEVLIHPTGVGWCITHSTGPLLRPTKYP